MWRTKTLIFVGLLYGLFGFVEPALDCGTPPDIEHSASNVTLSRSFAEGTTIEYVCDIMTFAIGEPFYTCYNGNWTNGADSHFTCLWKSCPTPFIKHGSYKADSLTVGNFATFKCDEGYKLRGPARVLCRISRRWRKLPTCELVRCPAPKQMDHMTRFQNTHGREYNIYGNEIHNKCEYDFNLIGPSLQTCENDGQWTGPAPYCEEISCGVPDVGNGTAYYESTTWMAHALIECAEGATLEGEEFIFCHKDGWSHSYCHAACQVPDIQNGDPVTVHLSHGQMFDWKCDDGYIKAVDEPITCQNGNLSSKPICKAVQFGNDSACPTPVPHGYHVTRFRDKCYIFIHVLEEISDARWRCRQRGWEMVSVRDQPEMAFISMALKQRWTDDTWLGIYFSDSHDDWVDFYGNKLAYTRWLEGEGGKYCLVFTCWKNQECAVLKHQTGVYWGWDDVQCYNEARVICEVKART